VMYVWIDALNNYVTACGFPDETAERWRYWPADVHIIGKDITRFHCALWPAMLLAAGVEPPRMVFGHGFVYRRDDDTGEVYKESKTRAALLGQQILEPMDIITKFSSEAFRYYFMRECPFPGDGEFSWQRFADVYNADLANNLGNLYSRVVTLISKNYGGHLEGTSGVEPGEIYEETDTEKTVQQVEANIEACQYNVALERIWRQILDPANRFADKKEPWKLVKTDLQAAKQVLYDLAEVLRVVSILLKPFLPRSAETIYRTFNFKQPWEEVRYEDVWVHPGQPEDFRIVAELPGGKPKVLFPRIG
jgi:methionyl-tRNA synthetase